MHSAHENKVRIELSVIQCMLNSTTLGCMLLLPVLCVPVVYSARFVGFIQLQ